MRNICSLFIVIKTFVGIMLNIFLQLFSLILFDYSLWNGFFIEGLPIKEIQDILIQLNGQQRIWYKHNELIQLTCQIINPNLFYIPFNNKSWNYFNYESCINFGRISEITLRIKLNKNYKLKKNSFLIRALLPNKISYAHGINLKYMPGKGFASLFNYYEETDRLCAIKKLLTYRINYNLANMIFTYGISDTLIF